MPLCLFVWYGHNILEQSLEYLPKINTSFHKKSEKQLVQEFFPFQELFEYQISKNFKSQSRDVMEMINSYSFRTANTWVLSNFAKCQNSYSAKRNYGSR